MKLFNVLITAALFCLSASTFAGPYVWWDQTKEASDSAISYSQSKNPTEQKYTVTLTIKGDESSNITYGLFKANSKSPYAPASKVEGENWWTLGNTSGSKEITLSSDVGLWADVYSNHSQYKYSLISANNWRTEAGGYEFSYSYNLNNGVSATITFTPVPATSGSPLPTPVVTLLIALALGAGFMMYRGRKQQAEA